MYRIPSVNSASRSDFATVVSPGVASSVGDGTLFGALLRCANAGLAAKSIMHPTATNTGPHHPFL